MKNQKQYKNFVTNIIKKFENSSVGEHLIFENINVHLPLREFTLVVYSMSKTRQSNKNLATILWKHIRHKDPDVKSFIFDFASDNFDDLMFSTNWEERSQACSNAMKKRLEVEGYNKILGAQLAKNWTPEKRSAALKKAWADGKYKRKTNPPKQTQKTLQVQRINRNPEDSMTPENIIKKRLQQSESLKLYWKDETKRKEMSLKKRGQNPEKKMTPLNIQQKRIRQSQTKKEYWTSEDTHKLIESRQGKSPEEFMSPEAIKNKRKKQSNSMKNKHPWEKVHKNNRHLWERLEEFYEFYNTEPTKTSNKGCKVGHRTAEKHFNIKSLKTIFLWFKNNGDPMGNQDWVKEFKS